MELQQLKEQTAKVIKPSYKANGEKYADVAINASCLFIADSILSLLDSQSILFRYPLQYLQSSYSYYSIKWSKHQWINHDF